MESLPGPFDCTSEYSNTTINYIVNGKISTHKNINGGMLILQTLITHKKCCIKKVKKLKPEKFFMGKPSQNYGVPPKYGAHNFTTYRLHTCKCSETDVNNDHEITNLIFSIFISSRQSRGQRCRKYKQQIEIKFDKV